MLLYIIKIKNKIKVMVPAAGGVFYSVGFVANPILASLLMTSSDVVIAVCSNIMRFFSLDLSSN